MGVTSQINISHDIIKMAVFIIFIMSIALYLFIIMIVKLRKMYVKIVKEKRKPKRKAVYQWIYYFFVRVAAIVVIVSISVSNFNTICDLRQRACMINNEMEIKEVVSQEFLEALQNIPFQDEVLNEAETVWESMLNQWLMYSEYRKLAEKNDNFAIIRDCYQENTDDKVEFPHIDINHLIEMTKEFYGSALLPATEYSFFDVEKIIDSYNDKLNVPVNIYKAEFWIWVSSRMGVYTSKALYQAGRSADDVLKVLYKNGTITVKEWIFFGSMAVSFYLASVEYDDGLRDLPLIYYRIAEIFIYLDKYSPLGNDEAYSRHFRLMAEKALRKVEETINDTYDCKKKLPYFSCYYAELLNDFRKLYPDEEENLTDMCRDYAAMCVMGTNGEKYCITCENILKELN